MVPVFDKEKVPLMPCSEKRARKLMEKGRAKPYWYKGVFCIILQDEPSGREMQDIVVAIDPGSKFNGYTVKSESKTLLNLQVNAITDVKKKMQRRKAERLHRRLRNTPYRKCRFNRQKNQPNLPASTKARWQQHVNMVKFLANMFPITDVAIEDIKAKSIKDGKRWNLSFAPLQNGKRWFEAQIEELGYRFHKISGWETASMRAQYGLKKNSKKDKKCFFTHCVDSFCIATEIIGGDGVPDNIFVKYLKPIRVHRRRLHEQVPKKGAIRKPYGGTVSLSFNKGCLVKHAKWGLTIVGGSSKGRISLHELTSNKRLCQHAKEEDLKRLTNIKWNIE